MKTLKKIWFWVKEKGFINLGLILVSVYLGVKGYGFFSGGVMGWFVCRNWNAIKEIYQTEIDKLFGDADQDEVFIEEKIKKTLK